jgi:hypothetical protein
MVPKAQASKTRLKSKKAFFDQNIRDMDFPSADEIIWIVQKVDQSAEEKSMEEIACVESRGVL